jgi:hypothetical protein
MQAHLGERIREPFGWLRRHDPSLAATRRAGRTALVMPALFALCTQVIHSVTMASFAAFGSFAMLLLVEFTGPLVQRLRAHLGLAVAWAVLISLGTLVARVTWLAVLCTVVIGFLVLFAGVVSSVLAGSATALLLGFVLPVTSPVPLSQLPDRLAGAGLAAGAAMLAITLLWPRSSVDPLSAPAARTCRAAAAQLIAEAELLAKAKHAPDGKQHLTTAQQASEAAVELRRAFTATPYRPTGLSTSSRALVRLVDELTWLSAIMAEGAVPSDNAPRCDPEAHAARRAAAVVLERAADLLEDPRHAGLEPLRAASEELREAMAAMERGATVRLPVDRPVDGTDAQVREFLSVLDLFLPRAGTRLRNTAGREQRRARGGGRATQLVRPAARPGARRRAPAAGLRAGAGHRAHGVALGLAAQQPARRGRARHRGHSGRGHQRPALLLGAARHALRAEVERAEHRPERAAGGQRDHRRLDRRSRAAAADRPSRHAAVVRAAARDPGRGYRAGRDLLRRRASRIHRHPGHPVQHRSEP